MALIASAVPARVRLAVLPTPLVDAPRLAGELGIDGRLLVKRDDLTGFGVAGNKARALELLAADAIARGADVLLTGGAPGSNFCAAAAVAALRIGVPCEILHSGHPRSDGAEHPNVQAARHWGARLNWTQNPNRRSVDAGLDERANALRAAGHHPYVMPRGGATPLGAVGYFLAAQELADQLTGPALVVVATGSGGTLAGLVAGAAAIAAPWTIVGASVSRSPEETRARVLELALGCARLIGAPAPDDSAVRVHDARGPGHARPSNDGAQAAAIALRSEGLVLDPVYTAKALGAVPEVQSEFVEPELTTVFWHTGGLLDAVEEWRRDAPR